MRTPPTRVLLSALPALLLVVAGLGGCMTDDEDAAASCEPSDIPDHELHTLVIEGDPWSGYAPFRNDRWLELGAHPQDGIYVEQLCQDVRAADLSSGRADIALTTLDQYLLHRPEGTVVGVIDQSRGADALALDTPSYPYLKGVDDLRRLVDELARDGDRPVLAYTGSSPSEMLLNELANTTEELHLSDYELVPVDQSATALQMLKNNEAQLAVIWEPDTSAARSAGYTIALSSRDVPDSIVDVIVASNDLIEHDPEAVQAVVSSFYEAMDDYLADPGTFQRMIAQDGGLTPSEADSVIAGIKLYGSAEADAFMNDDVFPLDQPQVERSLRSIGALLALLHPSVRPDLAAVDGSFVQEASP